MEQLAVSNNYDKVKNHWQYFTPKQTKVNKQL